MAKNSVFWAGGPVDDATATNSAQNTALLAFMHVAGTKIIPTCVCTGQPTSCETKAQAKVPYATTISNAFLATDGNCGSHPTTFVSRVCGANGNLTISIPGHTCNGRFFDNTHADSVPACGLYNFKITEPACACRCNFFSSRWFSVVSTPSTSTCNPVPFTSFFCLAFGITDWTGPNGRTCRSFTSTESPARFKLRYAASWKGMRALAAFNSTNSGSSTLTSRVNSAPGTQTISIPHGTTGIFSDTTHTDSISSTNFIDIQIAVGGTAGALQCQWIDTNMFSSSGSTSSLQDGGPGPVTFACTSFLEIAGAVAQASSPSVYTECFLSYPVRKAPFKLSNMFVNPARACTHQAATINLRHNKANSALVICVPKCTTGIFECTANTVCVSLCDLVVYKYTVNASSTFQHSITGVQLCNTAAPASSSAAFIIE